MEIREYKSFTETTLNYINLMRYLKAFRADELVKQFNHARTGLIFTLSSCKFRIREARKERNNIRKAKEYITKEVVADLEFTRQQFDSCAYSELTHCVIARIEWIREDRAYLANEELVTKYPLMAKRIRHSLDRSEKELRRLLKMRRVLKKSPYRNWDSRLLTLDMEPCEDFNLYEEFVKMNNKEGAQNESHT